MRQESKIDLSLVIPVFNEDRYLLKLFDGLIKYFNHKNTEIIVVDDGSTDNSKEIINKIKEKKHYNFQLKIVKLKKNSGKGRAIQEGIKKTIGKFIMLHDADLELDLRDSFEMYEMIKNNNDIKCIFGSRFLSGKLKKNNYFFNSLIGKLNSLIFNIFFSQSLSDVHCGSKILHRSVIDKINLSVNDFGIEIDLASQIVRNNFFIYEFGVSYYSRTKAQGKKITWVDGIKSFYYLIKVRFFDNTISTNISIIYSSLYMVYVGSHFGTGLGNILFIIIFFILGSIIGIQFKIFTSSLIFLFIYLGSFIGKGNGTTISVMLFLIFSIFLARKLKEFFLRSKFNHLF